MVATSWGLLIVFVFRALVKMAAFQLLLIIIVLPETQFLFSNGSHVKLLKEFPDCQTKFVLYYLKHDQVFPNYITLRYFEKQKLEKELNALLLFIG